MPSAIGSAHGELAVHQRPDLLKQPPTTAELKQQQHDIYANGAQSDRTHGSHSHNKQGQFEDTSNGNMRSSSENVGYTASMEPKARREIIELIDPEPTFDYLVLHGVLTRDDVSDIVQELEPSRQNKKLLELVEARSEVAGVQLLTNVLRLTGQHYLANLLDDGARIKALSGSGKANMVQQNYIDSLDIDLH